MDSETLVFIHKLDKISTQIADCLDKMNTSINKRLDKIDGRLDEIESHLSDINVSANDVEDRLVNLEMKTQIKLTR